MSVARSSLCSVLLGLCLLCSGSAFAGYIEQDASGSVAHMDDGRIRLEGSGDVYIVDTHKGTATLIVTRKRVYATVTVKQACAIVGAMGKGKRGGRRGSKQADGAGRRGADNALPEVIDQSGGSGFVAVPELRVGVGEAAELGPGAVKVKVRMMGQGEEIVGYRTVRYRVFREQRPYADLWIAKDRDLADEVKRLDLMTLFRLEACGAGPSIFGEDFPDIDVESTKTYRRILAMGWLMKKVRFWTDRKEVISEVARLRAERLPGKLFVAPGGYKEIPLKTLLRKHFSEKD